MAWETRVNVPVAEGGMVDENRYLSVVDWGLWIQSRPLLPPTGSITQLVRVWC